MTDYLEQIYNFQDPAFASVFDEVSLWGARFGNLLLDNLELMPNINVLDVGCGNGFPLFELAHTLGSSCQFTGVDVWEEALARARTKLAYYRLDNVQLLKTDGLSFPLPDNSFDLIISNLGLNNFENPQAVLAECARVAKPQARLILTTNIKGHFREFYEVYREVLTEAGKTPYLSKLDDHENHRGTKESVSTLVEQAEFTVTRVIEDTFQYRFLDGSAMFRHFLVKVGFLDGWRGVLEKEDEAEIFASLENKLNQLAREKGQLKMTVPMLYLEARRKV